MQRSEINKALKEPEYMCKKHCCYLPPFCRFTPEDRQNKGHEYDEIRDCCPSWDITDYGIGKLDKFGFSLINQAKVFHFGSLSLTDEPARSATYQAVAYAKAKDKLITYDPNLRKPLWRSTGEGFDDAAW